MLTDATFFATAGGADYIAFALVYSGIVRGKRVGACKDLWVFWLVDVVVLAWLLVSHESI